MKYVHTDPRTKLFVLLICAIAITISPSLYYEGGLVLCAEHGTNLAGASPVTGIYRQV